MKDKIEKLKKMKILFVEDEIELIKEISDILLTLEIDFLTAHHGKEALEILSKNSDIDLIITDIHMPVMDGIEMIKNLREKKSNIPCMIMSAHAQPKYVKSADELNIIDYIFKPFDFIKFLDSIDKLDIT